MKAIAQIINLECNCGGAFIGHAQLQLHDYERHARSEVRQLRQARHGRQVPEDGTAVLVKTHEHGEVNGQHIVSWYDQSYGWVVARHDAKGAQIGTADYVGHKSALASGIAYATFLAEQGDGVCEDDDCAVCA